MMSSLCLDLCALNCENFNPFLCNAILKTIQIKSLSCFVFAAKGQEKDKNPEEMNRLRDQLVSTFKEQMDIRLDLATLYERCLYTVLTHFICNDVDCKRH